jgi:DNA-binding NarL/FixJ family response regulator
VLIGVLGVANKPGGFDADDERLLSTFANQVAIAIDNARLYEQQRELITRLVSVVDLATSGSVVGGSRRRRPAPFDASQGASAGGPPEASGPVYDLLSDQQRAILRLISEGYSNREIASRVHLSENTVKSHIQEIFRKLGVRTRVEAAIRATREGLC